MYVKSHFLQYVNMADDQLSIDGKLLLFRGRKMGVFNFKVFGFHIIGNIGVGLVWTKLCDFVSISFNNRLRSHGCDNGENQ